MCYAHIEMLPSDSIVGVDLMLISPVQSVCFLGRKGYKVLKAEFLNPMLNINPRVSNWGG